MILEQEIKDRLKTALREAADDAVLLGLLPMQGPTYDRMRGKLAVAETCCRQMGMWREDARWFGMGIKMEQCHQMTRRWIVGHQPRKMFSLLAEKLREMERSVTMLETRATGRRGIILPEHAGTLH